MEPKLIIIEGTDRVGKSTLIEELHKATNYKHIINDRGVLSNIVYSQVYGRMTPELSKQYKELEKQIAKTNHLVIYLTCDAKILEQRRKDTNHEPVDFKYHQKLFASAVEATPLSVCTFDTAALKPHNIVQKLIASELV